MSVDLPAPLGPSNPIVRPERETRRSFRMSRAPKRTPNPASSIMGCIDSLPDRRFPSLGAGCRARYQRNQQLRQRRTCALSIQSYQRIETEPKKSAAAGDHDPIRFAVGVDQTRLAIRSDHGCRLLLIGRHDAAGLELVDHRSYSRAQVVIQQGGEVDVSILRQLCSEGGGPRKGRAARAIL